MSNNPESEIRRVGPTASLRLTPRRPWKQSFARVTVSLPTILQLTSANQCVSVSIRGSISAAVAAIRAGMLSPIELLDAALDRIRQFDERLHAWVLVDEAGARAAAQRLEQQARRGESHGPLHGIPIGVKDIIDVAGLPTAAGAPWRTGMIAANDAPLVARLRAAGAIILGKTVTTQLAYLDPPPTRNPWNLAHTPGGSSSGSAAATAAGMCWAAIGTQTGGSILRPAAYCGLVGCKPTFGSAPTAGVVPLAPSLDTVGPIARCVEDAATLLAILQDRPVEPFQLPATVRLGFVEEFFMAWAEEAVQDAVESSIEKLRAAGAVVEHVSLPAEFASAEHLAKIVMALEAEELHSNEMSNHAAEFGPKLTALINEGRYQREEINRQIERLGPGARSLFPGGGQRPFQDSQRRLSHEMGLFFATSGWPGPGSQSAAVPPPLILAMPTTPTPAPARLDTTGDARFNIPWTFAGLPAVTIPCGLSLAGMPIGLQLVGPRGADAELLAAAAWCERVLSCIGAPSLEGP